MAAVSFKIIFAVLLLAVASVDSFTVNAFDKSQIRHRAVAAPSLKFMRLDSFAAKLLKASEDTDTDTDVDTDVDTEMDTDTDTESSSLSATPTPSAASATPTAVPATPTASASSGEPTPTTSAVPSSSASPSPSEVAAASASRSVSGSASIPPSASVSPTPQTGSFVSLTVKLQGISAAQFTPAAQQAFKAAVARTAGRGVTGNNVAIGSFADSKSKASSLLVSFKVYGDSSSLSGISNSLSDSSALVSNLNSEFETAGVPVTVTGASVSTVSSEDDSKKKSDSLSGGEIAGIVIGCVVGATLIVFAFVFFRRRNTIRPRWSKVMG